MLRVVQAALDRFSVAVLSLIAGLREVPADLAVVMARGRRVVLREHPVRDVRCIRPALRPVADLQAHAPASGSDPVWVRVPALVRDPGWVEAPEGLFRLQVRLRVRNAPARMPGVDASNIRRRRKAR